MTGINNQLNSANSPFFLTKSVTLSNTDFQAVYATPLQIVAAPPAGMVHIVMGWEMMYVYGGTNGFTNGGNTLIQWGNTANGAGQATVQTMPASNFTGFGKSMSRQLPLQHAAIAKANFDGLGLFLSNQGAAFATGDNNSIICVVQYVTVPTGL